MIIDLSNALENDVPADPPGFGPRIEYLNHTESLPGMLSMFPGLRADQLPNGEGWGIERLQITTHNGTHMDAPWHYASTMNGGERAWTIDQIPLDWCFRPGVKLDFRRTEDGHVVSTAELERELGRIGHTLRPFDIVLINTAAGSAYGTPEYVDSGCGFGREATLWLLQQGVRIVGTDAWSWDVPFSFSKRRFANEGDPSVIWEGHKAGLVQAYCQLEKLTNLDKLPPAGFTVCCFPFKIRGASAGFTRAVAIVDE
jgi:kynurenine formamidase